MPTIVWIAIIAFALGEAALIHYLLGQIKRMTEDPYDPEWMDYEKWRKTR